MDRIEGVSSCVRYNNPRASQAAGIEGGGGVWLVAAGIDLKGWLDRQPCGLLVGARLLVRARWSSVVLRGAVTPLSRAATLFWIARPEEQLAGGLFSGPSHRTWPFACTGRSNRSNDAAKQRPAFRCQEAAGP